MPWPVAPCRFACTHLINTSPPVQPCDDDEEKAKEDESEGEVGGG